MQHYPHKPIAQPGALNYGREQQSSTQLPICLSEPQNKR